MKHFAALYAAIDQSTKTTVKTAALARYRLHDLDLILLRGVSEVTAVFGTFAVLAAAIFILREAVAESARKTTAIYT